MMKFSRAAILLAAALAVAGTSNAQAQGVRIGNRLIPASSIERPGDASVRAHTQLQILVGPPGGGLGFDGGLGPSGGMTPAQLRQAYNLPSAGGSQIIAVVDAFDNPNALADFNAFASYFGLPTEPSANATAATNKVFQVLYGNGSQPPTDPTGGWEVEEALDIEWAHAMAPNAKIILVESLDNSYDNLLGAEDTATNYTDGHGNHVTEVSNSWGSGEFPGETDYDSHFTSSSVSYFVSAGDSGAPPAYPSASPYVVSAGGTTVNTDSNGNFTTEIGWSWGGGGPSSYESRPVYQNGIASIVGSSRGTPDLSYDSDPNTGVSIYDSFPYEGTSYTWWVVGGTSVSSPSLAGIANLAATAAGSFPAGSQALLANIYANLGTVNFRDITFGNNGYPAMVGWDFVTGVGSCIGLAGLVGSSAPPPTVGSLTLRPATAYGGADNSTGTITLSGPAPSGGATVSLTSSNPSAASVPATLTVPAGSTTGTFQVTTYIVRQAVSVTITATYNNSSTANIEVYRLTINATGLKLNPTSVASGQNSTGTVTLDAAPSNSTGPVTVSLTSSNPGVASVPATVQVPVGSTTGTFTITTYAVTQTKSPTISASFNGNKLSVILTVTP